MEGSEPEIIILPFLAQAAYFTLFSSRFHLFFLIMVLVSWPPKPKHVFSLTTEFKVTASHDQISSASHLIENADSCAFSHLQKCFTFSKPTNTNFGEHSCPYLAFFKKKPNLRIHSSGSVCWRYFPLSSIFVWLKWLYSDFMPLTSVEEYLIENRLRISPWTLILCAGHWYSNIISTEKGGKKGIKRISRRIHVGINMPAPL